MKITPSLVIVFLLIQLSVVPLSRGQISNPVPQPIEKGDLILNLETVATFPSTSSSTPRARISVMRSLPDGRLFVNDLRGLLYEVNGAQTSLYLNLESNFPKFIDSPGLGTGFHSFAFHPDFATNGKFYTVHTEPWNSQPADFKGPVAPVRSTGQIGVLTEWTATDPAADTFSGTHRQLFSVYFPNTVHGLQEIAFNPTVDSSDPDYGMLYVCVGEGGSYLDGFAANDHRLDSPMGTVMRIDPLGNNSTNGAYGIPDDNPWVTAQDTSIIKEIFAYGFRNPHRLSWDAAGDHTVLLGDIGERNLEELNILLPGGDYGFPEREGTFVLKADSPNLNDYVYPLPENDETFGYIYPVAQYDHDEGFAIIGGYVYRGSQVPELNGIYIFGDIKNGRVLYLDSNVLEFGKQAEIKEVRLSIDGTETDILSIVGSSRADLRFGIDGQNELYFMTKSDGVLRKVVGVEFKPDQEFDSNPADWSLVENFETGGENLSFDRLPNGGTAVIASDPFGNGDNEVLAMKGNFSIASSSLGDYPLEGRISVYFRFALQKESSGASAGLNNQAFIINKNNLPIRFEAEGTGNLSLQDGNALTQFRDSIRSSIWYEAWLIYDNFEDNYDVYLRGDLFTAPTLIASGLMPKVANAAAFPKFVYSVTTNADPASLVFFDDVFLDTTGGNLSAPIGNSWQLVANFEADDAMDAWTFQDVDGSDITPPPSSSVSWLEKAKGNSLLSVRSTPSGATRTMGILKLPTAVQVGDVVTLYGRIFANDLAVNSVFGLSNQSPDSFANLGYDALEVIGRLSNDPPNYFQIRDESTYAPATGGDADSIQSMSWYEFWFVVRNGGEASGGQTFDVFWRNEKTNTQPTEVYRNADFRISREEPLTHFAFIANNGINGASGHVYFDDLYIRLGTSLERPVGTGSGIFPGAPSIKPTSWFGSLNDTYRPWVLHTNHGWIYAPEPQYDSLWFFDTKLGWTYTTPSLYPLLYFNSQSKWVYYYEGSSNPRYAYDFQSDQWVAID